MSDKMSQNEIDMLINQYSDKKQEEQQIKDSNNIINGTPDKKQSKAKIGLYNPVDFRKLNKQVDKQVNKLWN